MINYQVSLNSSDFMGECFKMLKDTSIKYYIQRVTHTHRERDKNDKSYYV